MTITGPSEAKVNDTVSLECTTSNSNPVARITWVVDGREMRENGSRIATSPDGGWVSSSNLTTVIRATGRNVTVSCHAIVADLAQRVAETKIISVVCKLLLPFFSKLLFFFSTVVVVVVVVDPLRDFSTSGHCAYPIVSVVHNRSAPVSYYIRLARPKYSRRHALPIELYVSRWQSSSHAQVVSIGQPQRGSVLGQPLFFLIFFCLLSCGNDRNSYLSLVWPRLCLDPPPVAFFCFLFCFFPTFDLAGNLKLEN